MYDWTLIIHSALRWLVLAAGLYALVRAIGGLSGGRPFTPADDSAGRWLTLLVDLQLVVGLILYAVLSPVLREAFSDFGAAMGDRTLRFWAVEHTFGMALGLIVIHVARARSRRSDTDARKHRIALIGYGIGLLVIVASIPWPFLSFGRVLFRLP